MGNNSKITNEFNRTAAGSSDIYKNTDFGIKKTDEETRNIISSTFGMIKQNILNAFWYSTGLDPNVNNAYYETMTDPEQSFEVNGKRYYPHPGVGNLMAYNEMGNPSGGCFTMQTMG